jgi:hypothetical protein
MSGTLASLVVAVSMGSVGGIFPDGSALHHLFPPPEEGGFFFRHHDRTPLPLPQHYVERQAACTPHHHGYILPPGPGNGWGFPNGNPDEYGYLDYGTYLPLGGDRNPDYYFPRYYSLLPEQTFLPSYYNPYVQRGQRYIPYTACGGAHPFGGAPLASSETPENPDQRAARTEPFVTPPTFTGRTEAPPTAGYITSPTP